MLQDINWHFNRKYLSLHRKLFAKIGLNDLKGQYLNIIMAWDRPDMWDRTFQLYVGPWQKPSVRAVGPMDLPTPEIDMGTCDLNVPVINLWCVFVYLDCAHFIFYSVFFMVYKMRDYFVIWHFNFTKLKFIKNRYIVLKKWFQGYNLTRAQ